MAKSPKKRAKKGTGIDFKRKEVDSIVNLSYQRVKFLGDCFHTPRACGVQQLWTHLRGPYHDVGMKYFIHHITREMDWTLNVSCFFKSEEEEGALDVVQAVAVFQDTEMEYVSTSLSEVIIETVNLCLQADERYSNKNAVYYAYCLWPEFGELYEDIGDGLSDLMINLDDLSQFKPFDDKLPGHPSDKTTLLVSLKNNGIFPRMKERSYWPYKDEIYCDDTSFLLDRTMTNNETL